MKKFLKTLANALFTSCSRPASPRRDLRPRLGLESLEQRDLMSVASLPGLNISSPVNTITSP